MQQPDFQFHDLSQGNGARCLQNLHHLMVAMFIVMQKLFIDSCRPCGGKVRQKQGLLSVVHSITFARFGRFGLLHILLV